MPPSNSLAAHQPFLDIWAKAVASPKGIKVRTENPVDLRGRLYHARVAERKNNTKVFQPDHAMHGRSYYDSYTIKVERTPEGVPEPWVLIIPGEIEIEGVEEL